MPITLNNREFVIGDDTPPNLTGVCDGRVGGVYHARGAVPRDFSVQPRPMQGLAFDLIPEAEWPERIKDKVAEKAQLSDVRNTMDGGKVARSYDQNGQGYCWAYSTTAANTLARATSGLPHVRLSAHSIACVIKQFRDQGGWCGLSMERLQSHGVIPEAHWPAKSMDRKYDTPANWAEAAKYKVNEGWVDLDAAVYDRNLTFPQTITLLLANIPLALDFNWWGHSVCGMDAVDGAQQRNVCRGATGKLLQLHEFDSMWGMSDPMTRGIGVRIWNSWTDDWSDNGTGVLTGSKAVPNGAVGIVSPNM